MHIVSDLNDSLSDRMRELLDANEPPQNATDHERRDRYTAMGIILNQNLDWAFRSNVPCLCHSTGFHLDALLGSHLVCDASPSTIAAGKFPLCMWVAGSCCQDFSARGKLGKDAGPTMRAWKVLGLAHGTDHMTPGLWSHTSEFGFGNLVPWAHGWPMDHGPLTTVQGGDQGPDDQTLDPGSDRNPRPSASFLSPSPSNLEVGVMRSAGQLSLGFGSRVDTLHSPLSAL